MRYMNAPEHSDRYFDALLAQLDRALDFYQCWKHIQRSRFRSPRRAKPFLNTTNRQRCLSLSLSYSPGSSLVLAVPSPAARGESSW